MSAWDNNNEPENRRQQQQEPENRRVGTTAVPSRGRSLPAHLRRGTENFNASRGNNERSPGRYLKLTSRAPTNRKWCMLNHVLGDLLLYDITYNPVAGEIHLGVDS